MNPFTLSFGGRVCSVRIGAREFDAFFDRLAKNAARGALVLTDSNVFERYRAKLEAVSESPVYVLPAGEACKTQENLFGLLSAMAEHGLRRNSVLIAVGGGTVCDLGGLAAALYMRGIDCVYAPTTLLAQADAAIGGKCAVDFCGIKNLVGTVRLPDEVISDPTFLLTLPARELRNGLGEIVKHAALCPTLFERLWQGRDRLTDPTFLSELVPASASFKREIVEKDPYEKDLRKCLNLGHTTAHALEPEGILSHGECVLAGLICESEIAERFTDCDRAFLEKLRAICRAALGGVGFEFGAKALLRAKLDKKNISENSVALAVPVALGRWELLTLPFERYEREVREALFSC